jgi:hypothetical protein
LETVLETARRQRLRSPVMKLLRPATEAEMVLAFVRAEVDRESLPAWARVVIDAPDTSDESQNALRARLLDRRGYRQNESLFKDFPADVSWQRASLTIDELSRASYINCHEPTWQTYSGGTRLIADGARNVGKVTLPNDPTAVILAIAAAVKQGRSFPELILVGSPNANPEQLVLLEGHKRATAYVYGGQPSELETLVGFSPDIDGWYWF